MGQRIKFRRVDYGNACSSVTGLLPATGRYLVRLPTLSGANFLANVYSRSVLWTQLSKRTDKRSTHWFRCRRKLRDDRWRRPTPLLPRTTTFSTGPDAIVYGKKHSDCLRKPSSCFSPPQSILVKNVSSGSLQPLKKFDINTYVSLQAVTEQPVAGGQNPICVCTTRRMTFRTHT